VTGLGSGSAAYAVVTGGGTAGHVLPALAIAEALVDRGHAVDEIHYVGARRGIETRLVPPTGHPYTFLDVVGIQRRLDRANLSFPTKLARAERRAEALLRDLRPRVVVSVGGYASLPAVFGARRLRIPIVAISYDRRPGRATQLTARFAAASAVAFEGSGLPRARLTGAPLRRAILTVDRDRDRGPSRELLGLPSDRFVLLATGGSLGSAALNDVVAAFVELNRDRADLAVRHVAGERFDAEARERAAGAGGTAAAPRPGILYQVIGYEDQMPEAYAAADLVVSRAGASTVAELTAIGLPSILVPWPGAAADHQTGNARSLADVGAAVLLPETELSAARLGAELDRLRTDPGSLQAMSAAARAAGEIHRSGRLAQLIEEVASS
jgi:UDP-N-acetylglucosamine--N-acetylmuramyl-(pentapeptide) pyrophosphoryl-undecaprenol N-acetylglucosamine transferase